VNLILQIAIEFRLAVLFVAGVGLGSLLNFAVYTLCWETRLISPWSRPSDHAPPRYWQDRVPVFGWLGLRRETDLHGTAFWIRPMILEVLCGVGLAALYWWEVRQVGLLPGVVRPFAAGDMEAALHAQFVCHVLLISLLLVGSLIDIDEKIIPDSITVPGTLVGLLAAAVYPWAMLPTDANPQTGIEFLRLTSPNDWPNSLGGYPRPWPLVLGSACWWMWCFALMPRTWYTRHGWIRAAQLMIARLLRESHTRLIVLMGVLGTGCIAAVWYLGTPYWTGLLSSLVGMAASGGIVWAVRVLGTWALGREAMGFGDVTLMAMIGAFLGWQPCLMVFFLAPFAGLLIGVLSVVLRSEHEIPYGPFLSLAAVAVVIWWGWFWDFSLPYFRLGWVIPLVVVVCLALMAVMLGLIRLGKRALGVRY
jgi:prepilin signal peptidase PulO-like enzyme (type II secretory pathway)